LLIKCHPLALDQLASGKALVGGRCMVKGFGVLDFGGSSLVRTGRVMNRRFANGDPAVAFQEKTTRERN
jgi:hypothetical protein